jgi:predicted transposase YdaD
MTPHPHDALIKSAFESPAAAAALLRELLPAHLRDAVIWDSLVRESGSFITAELADRHSDLLFSARVHSGNKVYLYLLMEHQSTEDPTMPLRMLSSEVQIWDRVRKETPDAPLAPVIAVVIAHVPGGWRSSRAFADMFDPAALAIPGLAALVPQFSLIIEDLSHLSDDDLHARSLAAFQKVALWLLRDGRDSVRLLSSFSAWTDAMLQARRAPGGANAFTALITYMFRVIDPVKRDELRAKLCLLGHHAEETAMSIADQLHQTGLEKGLEIGRVQGIEIGRREGREEGREEGRREGREEARRVQVDGLRRILVHKFGAVTAIHEAKLRAATPRTLDRYFDRALTADSPTAVFGGVRPQKLAPRSQP